MCWVKYLSFSSETVFGEWTPKPQLFKQPLFLTSQELIMSSEKTINLFSSIWMSFWLSCWVQFHFIIILKNNNTPSIFSVGSNKKQHPMQDKNLSLYTTKMPCILQWWKIFVDFTCDMWITLKAIITTLQVPINFQSAWLCFLKNEFGIQVFSVLLCLVIKITGSLMY